MFSRFAAGFALAGLALCAAAGAQEYPSKPVRVIVGNAAGGPIDVAARTVAEALASKWSQPVVVENKPGANEIIGANTVAKSAPDGYTLFFSSGNPFTNNPSLFPNLPYDPARDFTSIVLAAQIPMAFIAATNAPFDTLPGLIDYAKKHPGKLSWASPGLGSMNHIAGEWMAYDAGIKSVQVPYKGGPASMNAVVAREVPYGVVSLLQAIPFVKAGTVKMLAVTTEKRTSLAPDLPTVAELSVRGFDASILAVLTAPKGTPPDIVAKINRDVNEVLKRDAIRSRLASLGAEALGSTPAELDQAIAKTRNEVSRIVSRVRIKVD